LIEEGEPAAELALELPRRLEFGGDVGDERDAELAPEGRAERPLRSRGRAGREVVGEGGGVLLEDLELDTAGAVVVVLDGEVLARHRRGTLDVADQGLSI